MILSILHFVDTKSVKTRTTGCIYLTWRCLHVLKQWNVTRVLKSLIKQHSQWRTAIMRKISLIQVGEMFEIFHYINCFHIHSIDFLICELNNIVRCSSYRFLTNGLDDIPLYRQDRRYPTPTSQWIATGTRPRPFLVRTRKVHFNGWEI